MCGLSAVCIRDALDPTAATQGCAPIGELWAWLDAADNFGDEEGLLHQQHEPQYAEQAIARRAFFDIGNSVQMWIDADGGGLDGEPLCCVFV